MQEKQISLFEIAKVFLTIGTIGVGGWPAIVALMQKYCVEDRKWLSIDEFSHGIALGQFLGPFAVNATIFVGYRARKFKGAMVALFAFLAPSVICVIILSALYTQFHTVPSLQSALKGISPVVIALLLSAAYQMMGKDRIKSIEPIILMSLAILLSAFLKVQVIGILLIALVYGFIKIKFLKLGAEGGNNEGS